MTGRPEEESGDLFASAAADYARYRPGIPSEAVRLLAGTVRGAARPVVLDLGSGTGQVAAALLPALAHVARLDLVDPDAGMLREAAETLAPLLGDCPAGFHRVGAEDFTPPFDGYRADLVTCARAFHWMPRPAVLSMADRVTAPRASMAIMGDGSLWTHPTQWTTELKRLIQSYLGPRWTPAAVVGYLRSTSFARPALFGDLHARFEQEAHLLLEEHGRNEGLIEDAVFTVLLARRPGGDR
jgi:SAM-dependent methyltransferase